QSKIITTTLTSTNQFDVDDFYLSSDDAKPAIIFYDALKPRRKVLDKQLAIVATSLEKYQPDAYWSILSANKNNDRFVISIESPTHSPQLVLLDIKRNKLIELQKHPGASAIKLSAGLVIANQGEDNQISGYITLPSRSSESQILDSTNKNSYPLLIRVHGGPFEVREKWRFDPEAHWLASQGIALLTFNYRGSDGFGEAFKSAAFQQLRTTFEEDISDIVGAAMKQYPVDISRVCLYGASYGGNAVLSEVIEQGDDYSCAILHSAVTDLAALYQTLDEKSQRQFIQQFGNPRDPKWLNNNDLLKDGDDIEVPLLVIYGGKDKLVAPDQSEKLVSALDNPEQKKLLTKVYLEQADHHFSNQQHKAAMYNAIAQFLKLHLLQRNGAQ
ncbi:MAG: prolyl oligopeptidase family serine peptidase, partial [Kangiellaceae bacterium]|nr:prolyl oligopeptidase family serine peptidase [Kangiellaceae bacterium]